jgi:hypothetical protein
VTVSDDSKDDSTDDRTGSPQVANGSRDLDLRGVVEPALSRALLLAVEAGQWALVSQLASELDLQRRRVLKLVDQDPPIPTRESPGDVGNVLNELRARRYDVDRWLTTLRVHPRAPQAPPSKPEDPIEKALRSGKLRRIKGGRP